MMTSIHTHMHTSCMRCWHRFSESIRARGCTCKIPFEYFSSQSLLLRQGPISTAGTSRVCVSSVDVESTKVRTWCKSPSYVHAQHKYFTHVFSENNSWSAGRGRWANGVRSRHNVKEGRGGGCRQDPHPHTHTHQRHSTPVLSSPLLRARVSTVGGAAYTGDRNRIEVSQWGSLVEVNRYSSAFLRQ